jgi:preprotein translocase subunit SecD
MIRRRLWAWVAATVGVVAAVLALNLGFGNTPALGLDLQGGLSVILAPSESASGDDLLVIRDLIRDELERRGIAEPDVRVEGDNIIVDLPGVRDQRDALDAVDVAGIVTLRPVYQCVAGPAPGESTTTSPGGTAPGSTTPGSTPGTSTLTSGSTGTTGASAPASSGAPTSSPPSSAPDSTPAGFANPAANDPEAAPTTAAAPSTTNGPTTTAGGPTTTAPTGPTTTAPGGSTTTTVPGGTTTVPGTTTPPVQPDTEVLPLLDGGECIVGPSGGTGEVFGRGSARADLDPQQGWVVNTTLTSAGNESWNALAFQCYQGLETCPSRQLAIVLDDVIQSAPTVNEANFPNDVQISGMDSEGDARSLARVLNRGAFPVDVQAQTVQTVSPTLGQDSLRAAVIAGMIGVVLVLLLLVVFYRRLTLLIIAGMVVWAMLIYSASAIISQTTNYALTLAGVTGIIVSIGVTVDSYVVYFERLKDEVRHGRTIKNSANRAFKASWRTIVAADLVSILAAAVLFILSVGSVRGFALYLGITTVCDLIVFFCFTRPAVALLASSGRLDNRDTFGLGLAK